MLVPYASLRNSLYPHPRTHARTQKHSLPVESCNAYGLRFHPILKRCLKGFITVTAPLQHIFQFVRSLFLSTCSSLLLGVLWCITLSPAQSAQQGISPYHSTHYPQISSPGLRCSFFLKIPLFFGRILIVTR